MDASAAQTLASQPESPCKKRIRANTDQAEDAKRPCLQGQPDADPLCTSWRQVLSEDGIAQINAWARHALEIGEDFREFSEFMVQGNDAVHQRASTINYKLVEVKQIFEKFVHDLQNNSRAISSLMDRALSDLAAQDRWWQSVNIFSPKFNGGLMYAIREEQSVDSKWFFELLDQQLESVFDLNSTESWMATIGLYIIVKPDILQHPVAKDNLSNLSIEWHEKIDEYLKEMLKSDMERYTDAVKACQHVRECMSRHACKATAKSKCVYNTLLPTLEILQKRAYHETRHKVFQTIGTLLPAELTERVFGYALVAEDIPQDTRIFINARHKDTGKQRTKARLICEHSVRERCNDPDVWNWTLLEHYGYKWVWGPEWEEHDVGLWNEEEYWQDRGTWSIRNYDQHRLQEAHLPICRMRRGSDVLMRTVRNKQVNPFTFRDPLTYLGKN
ncbi:hypothetical protein EK21DRAFT_106308 [Setomelanomma holmii]|uniref:Uncharacterized protein n=1 Tax=Setomelanomma holmii TaxID=210430 RepID=A0A9P4HKF6_9PLEO|nr:hypothetical protein EK21DRAFT_106308 [Setomelanomma holmii]